MTVFFRNQVTDLGGGILDAYFGFRDSICILLKDSLESTGAN